MSFFALKKCADGLLTMCKRTVSALRGEPAGAFLTYNGNRITKWTRLRWKVEGWLDRWQEWLVAIIIPVIVAVIVLMEVWRK